MAVLITLMLRVRVFEKQIRDLGFLDLLLPFSLLLSNQNTHSHRLSTVQPPIHRLHSPEQSRSRQPQPFSLPSITLLSFLDG
ncbi:hypothetical protein HanXRQr2_Chr01g0008811 [Helianthus annuus]|uniref:Uncharacterized protein n=1 Tax=Helianthus annuus TaxID=4232 RepID=A0A9K3P233_HELAN|nr:hypothetical protein HanXRQr2_Chr01g0008811 [Helianthus annuus]